MPASSPATATSLSGLTRDTASWLRSEPCFAYREIRSSSSRDQPAASPRPAATCRRQPLPRVAARRQLPPDDPAWVRLSSGVSAWGAGGARGTCGAGSEGSRPPRAALRLPAAATGGSRGDLSGRIRPAAPCGHRCRLALGTRWYTGYRRTYPVAHAARPDPAPPRARGRPRAGRPHREYRLPRRSGTLAMKEPHPSRFRVDSRARVPITSRLAVFGPVDTGESVAVTGHVPELVSAASPDRRGGCVVASAPLHRS
jgi:hypothetical protein